MFTTLSSLLCYRVCYFNIWLGPDSPLYLCFPPPANPICTHVHSRPHYPPLPSPAFRYLLYPFTLFLRISFRHLFLVVAFVHISCFSLSDKSCLCPIALCSYSPHADILCAYHILAPDVTCALRVRRMPCGTFVPTGDATGYTCRSTTS